jgi:PLP dependent protein
MEQWEDIAANAERLHQRVSHAAKRAGRTADEITIVAVSKTFPAQAVRAAYEAGFRHFGENRVQEFESKRAELMNLDATWRLIGHLQSNKARRAVEVFDRIDSVDSGSLAVRLDAAAAERGKQLPVLIEVHLGGEVSKSGVDEAGLAELAKEVGSLAHLQLLGLMTIPPYEDDLERVRPYFRKLRELRDDLSQKMGLELRVVSMGMSHDFEVGIEEGATEIRVGTAIFGERFTNTKPPNAGQ